MKEYIHTPDRSDTGSSFALGRFRSLIVDGGMKATSTQLPMSINSGDVPRIPKFSQPYPEFVSVFLEKFWTSSRLLISDCGEGVLQHKTIVRPSVVVHRNSSISYLHSLLYCIVFYLFIQACTVGGVRSQSL